MKHYVMTRSSYGPEWSLEANRRRLDITRGITARLMRRQKVRDWTWIALLDSRDPLIHERMEVVREAAPHFEPIIWTPGDEVAGALWDKHAAKNNRRQKVAATAYRHPGWLQLTPRDEPILQTRVDDDDGLAVDYMRRVRAATDALSDGRRVAIMLPIGYRVWDGRYSVVQHDTNAMHTLFTPAGDETTVYSYGHRLVARKQPIVIVDRRPGWLWVRHPDTISGWRKADAPITLSLRLRFPIDWSVLE
jgi:hypothetical protein